MLSSQTRLLTLMFETDKTLLEVNLGSYQQSRKVRLRQDPSDNHSHPENWYCYSWLLPNLSNHRYHHQCLRNLMFHHHHNHQSNHKQ